METFLNAEKQNEFAIKLQTVIEEFNSEINHCQEQSDLWQERKKQLKTQMTEALQKHCGVLPTSNTETTISQLIRSFLEKNGPARPRDIRKFLLSQGRNTNPGVALGRMVADGAIKNMERGVYIIS